MVFYSFSLDIMRFVCIIMSIQNNTHDAHASQEELNMKKYLALLLAAIMALSLAACASTAKTEDAASTSGKLTMATEATFQP